MIREIGWLWLVLVALVVMVLLVAGCKSYAPEDPVVALSTDGGVGFAGEKEAGEMTAEWVAGAVAVVVSLLLEVVPGLAEQWNGLDGTYKRLAWLAGCLLIPLAIVGVGCAGLDLGVIAPACDADGFVEALTLGFTAYFAGQLAYAVAGKKVRVKRGIGSKE